MARTIAERLAYNRAYSPELNPNLFDEDGQLYPQVREKIEDIVDEFLKYAQVDIKVVDIRLVGSNASYNYNEHSDLDIHIVVDLSKISNPETIARLYFDSIKKNFKESYDIKIKGIDVELYVEDLKTSAHSNGVYSVSTDHWIREPEVMPDPSDDQIAEAEEIEDDIINKIKSAQDIDTLEEIVDELYLMRKNALVKEGETAPANLAFKSLRNKGILQKIKDTLHDEVSKELSLESKKMRESHIPQSAWRKPRTPDTMTQHVYANINGYHISIFKKYVYSSWSLLIKKENSNEYLLKELDSYKTRKSAMIAAEEFLQG